MIKFLSKIDKHFEKIKWTKVVLLLSVLIALSCWRLLNLYISHDDWDLFFKVIHPESGVWGTGPGPFGSGPYRYFHTVFIILYPFLKFNIPAYFFVGMLIYLFASFAIYLLFLEITENRKLSLFIASIFSSLGLFGSDALMHLQHLYAMFGMMGFSFLTLRFLLRHFKTGNLIFYLLSLILFTFTEEFYVLRGHGLIFVILFGALLFVPFKNKIKDISVFCLKLLPFLYIYNHQYNSGGGGFLTITINYLKSYNGAFASFINFPATFANSLIPDFFTNQIYSLSPRILFFAILFISVQVFLVRKINKKILIALLVVLVNYIFILFTKWSVSQPILRANGFDNFSGFLAFMGLETGMTIIIIALINYKSNKTVSKILIFGILWFFSQYLGYFIASPAYDLLSTGHRYMTPEIAGSAMIFASLIFLIKNLKMKYFALIVLIGIFINLLNSEIARNASEINVTRNVYASIVKETPKLPKSPLIFLDYEDDSVLRGRVRDAYPNTAFALFYGFSDRVPSAQSFTALINLLKVGKTSLDNIQTYYIGKTLIENTTAEVRKLLSEGSSEQKVQNAWTSPSQNGENTLEPIIDLNKERTLGVSSEISISLNYKSVVPMLLSVKMAASSVDYNNITYPFQDLTADPQTESFTNSKDLSDLSIQPPSLSCNQRTDFLKQRLEHDNFIKTATVSADSEWEDNKVSNLIDGNYVTDWTAHPNYWNNVGKVGIYIDLGSIQSIRRVNWINHFKRTTPVSYSYSVSNNNLSWKTVKVVENGDARNDDEIVSDIFPNDTTARYIKMDITKTLTALSPSIRELWVSQYDIKASNDSEELISHPLYCPSENANEVFNILSYIPYVRAKLLWRNNSDKLFNPDKNEDISIIPDGQMHSYNFYIPAGGTKLEGLKISGMQIPLKLQIEETSIRSLSLKEIEDKYSN